MVPGPYHDQQCYSLTDWYTSHSKRTWGHDAWPFSTCEDVRCKVLVCMCTAEGHICHVERADPRSYNFACSGAADWEKLAEYLGFSTIQAALDILRPHEWCFIGDAWQMPKVYCVQSDELTFLFSGRLGMLTFYMMSLRSRFKTHRMGICSFTRVSSIAASMHYPKEGGRLSGKFGSGAAMFFNIVATPKMMYTIGMEPLQRCAQQCFWATRLNTTTS